MDDSKAILLRDDVKLISDLNPETQLKINEFGIILKPYTFKT